MRILTHENKPYNLDRIPDEIEDIRYCVFDCSDRQHTDYYFYPLIFLESFYAPAIVLRIGEYTVQVPLDWSIVVCDEEMTDMEVVALTSLNDRGFYTVAYNPLKHMVTKPMEVEIIDIYADVKWFFPKLKSGALLVSPLTDVFESDCALFVKEANKIPDDLQLAELFE